MAQSSPAPPVGVYTIAEAARRKGVSYHTVSRAVRTGKLPARRIGRMAMIAAEDLDAWQPVVENTPYQYRGRQPDPAVSPVLMDIVAGEWTEMARRLSALQESVALLTSELTKLRAEVTELRDAIGRDSG